MIIIRATFKSCSLLFDFFENYDILIKNKFKGK